MSKKTIYKFTVKKEEEVEEETTLEVENKETKEIEKVTTTKTVKKEVPYEIRIAHPSRRQIEDADMEFSIEMSKCIKKGILTKAMLAKKYSDSGGLLSEEDSSELIRSYRELAELQNDLGKLMSKKKKTDQETKKEEKLTESFSVIRKRIVDLETTYQSVFNHTADTKAQNKTILWYMLNLSYVTGPDETEVPLFSGETTEAKEESYYLLDENEDEVFDLAREKLMTFVSFWYFSQNASDEDFSNLEKDIDSGEV
tara:strand:+ start:2886 stop:3650 length:765 start_codon:yes stop_codon:yes gene_type:complete